MTYADRDHSAEEWRAWASGFSEGWEACEWRRRRFRRLYYRVYARVVQIIAACNVPK